MKPFLLHAGLLAALSTASIASITSAWAAQAAGGGDSMTPGMSMGAGMTMGTSKSTGSSQAEPATLGRTAGPVAESGSKQAGGLTRASGGWVRWLPANLPAAGYVTVFNAGKTPIDLTSASSPDYQQVMLHQSIANGSTDRMVMVAKLTIPAGGSVQIAPSGYHLMLMSATRSIAPGDTVHVTLHFSDGSSLLVPMAVRSPSGSK
jgi:copper(I)-binding protein